ncbi:MAG TPA: hypothetical protein PLQ35_03655 [bacterium]|nr:hypothetical protein [bacterium]HQL61367.1 hypothetical protein [bacterium]
MKNLAAVLVLLLCFSGCSSVKKISSNTWGGAKSLFGMGEPKQPKKVTVETYQSRTVVSTVEQPEMQVQTEPKKVEVQPLVPSAQETSTEPAAPATSAAPTVPAAPAASQAPTTETPDRANLSPDERRLQEEIDRKVNDIRHKHSNPGLMGVFK